MALIFDIEHKNESLQFTGNLPDIVVHRIYYDARSVQMSIVFDDVILCENLDLYFNHAGVIEIKTREIAHGLISYNLYDKTTKEKFHKLIVRLKDDVDGVKEVAIPLIDGVIAHTSSGGPIWWQENFLTWQPQTIEIPSWQPQWLSLALLGDKTIRIKTTLYTLEGTRITKDIGTYATQGLLQLKVVFQDIWGDSIPAEQTPIAYDVFGVEIENKGTQQEKEKPNSPFTQRYVLRPDRAADCCFIYQNSLGGFDSIIATGTQVYTPKGDVLTFINNGNESERQGSYRSAWEQNTGIVDTQRDARLWFEFFNSSNKYIYDNNKETPIKIVVDEYEVKSTQKELNSYSFKFHLSKSNEAANYERSELGELELPEKYYQDDK